MAFHDSGRANGGSLRALLARAGPRGSALHRPAKPQALDQGFAFGYLAAWAGFCLGLPSACCSVSQTRRQTMEDKHAPAAKTPTRRPPWNKGKLVGAKPPLRP